MLLWRLINGSLKARIVAVFLGLLLVVQLAGFGAIRASLSNHALNELPQRLSEGDRVLRRLLEQKAQKLSDGARLLASDYGFREAIHTSDTNTIVSALENHGELGRRHRMGPVAQSAQQFGEVRRQHALAALALFLVLSPALQKKREEAFHEE